MRVFDYLYYNLRESLSQRANWALDVRPMKKADHQAMFGYL